MPLDEYGRDESTLPPLVLPLRTPSGRLRLSMVQILEVVSQDARAGRTSGGAG